MQIIKRSCALKKRRPFVPNLNLNICEIFSSGEKKRYKSWRDNFESFLGVYNDTEVLLIYMIYIQGFTRAEIVAKTHKITKHYYDAFRRGFKTTDEFEIVKAENKWQMI